MSVITPETVVQRSDHLLTSDVDNETVMMDIDRGDYFGLNEVGSRIWKLSQNPISVNDLCTELEKEYGVTSEQCEADVKLFLAELVEQNFIRTQTPG